MSLLQGAHAAARHSVQTSVELREKVKVSVEVDLRDVVPEQDAEAYRPQSWYIPPAL